VSETHRVKCKTASEIRQNRAFSHTTLKGWAGSFISEAAHWKFELLEMEDRYWEGGCGD